jgi:hypothetical protein
MRQQALTMYKATGQQTYIERAVSQGFIKGYPDGSFKPDKNVSRAEFVSMVNRALENLGTTQISFSDVPYSQWFYNDVAKAVSAAYVTGFIDGTFKPNQSVTRQEASVMIAKFIPTYGYSGRLQAFSDYNSISSWAREAMSKVNGKGYINGYSDGKIHPLDPLTRAQAAKIISDIIRNETIVSTDPLVKKSGTKLADTIYSNNVTMHRDLSEGSATIDNCVVLGSLSVQGGGSSTITVNNSRVANAIVNKSASSGETSCKGGNLYR